MPYLIEPRYTQRMDWYRWHSGDTADIWRGAASQVNGLAFIPPETAAVGFNYFAAQSKFFSDAMLSEIPAGVGDAYNLLRTMTQDWAITGEAVLVKAAGEWRAIQSRYFMPYPRRDDSERFERYFFVFPILTEANTLTAEARVIEVDGETGEAWTGIRNWTGGWVGEPRGMEERYPLEQLIWLRSDDGAYGEMRDLVGQVNMRMAMLQANLNRATYPAIAMEQFLLMDRSLRPWHTGSGNTPQWNPRITDWDAEGRDLAEKMSRGLGPVIELQGIDQDKPSYIERQFTLPDQALEYLRLLLGKLTIISGVPDYIYGVNLGQPAAETERVLFAGQAKVNRFRRQVSDAFAVMGREVEWVTEPFVTRTQRVDLLLKLLESGVIDVGEIRKALGLA